MLCSGRLRLWFRSLDSRIVRSSSRSNRNSEAPRVSSRPVAASRCTISIPVEIFYLSIPIMKLQFSCSKFSLGSRRFYLGPVERRYVLQRSHDQSRAIEERSGIGLAAVIDYRRPEINAHSYAAHFQIQYVKTIYVHAAEHSQQFLRFRQHRVRQEFIENGAHGYQVFHLLHVVFYVAVIC